MGQSIRLGEELCVSYVSNRKQFVKVGDLCSSCLDITCGVPLGVSGGPRIVYSAYQRLIQDIKSIEIGTICG